MTFPFSVAAIVFAFSSGMLAASLIYYLIKIFQKKNLASSKTILSFVSLSLVIASTVFYMTEISQDVITSPFTGFNLSDYIFVGAVFVIGVLFFCFTTMSFFIGITCYVVFSVFSIIVLTTVYSNKTSFEITVNSKEECNAIELVSHEINPKILLPCKRFWYENPKKDSEKKEAMELNPVFKFMTKFLFSETKTLSAKIPPEEFYPVIYQVQVKDSEINVFVKLNRLL